MRDTKTKTNLKIDRISKMNEIEDLEIEELIEEREKLLKKIKDRQTFLKGQRRTRFLMIWLGYAAIIFYVLLNITPKLDNSISLGNELLFVLFLAISSLFFALLFYGANSLVWTSTTLEINYTVEHLEQLYIELNALEKKYNEINKRRGIFR